MLNVNDYEYGNIMKKKGNIVDKLTLLANFFLFSEL